MLGECRLDGPSQRADGCYRLQEEPSAGGKRRPVRHGRRAPAQARRSCFFSATVAVFPFLFPSSARQPHCSSSGAATRGVRKTTEVVQAACISERIGRSTPKLCDVGV